MNTTKINPNSLIIPPLQHLLPQTRPDSRSTYPFLQIRHGLSRGLYPFLVSSGIHIPECSSNFWEPFRALMLNMLQEGRLNQDKVDYVDFVDNPDEVFEVLEKVQNRLDAKGK